MTWLIFLLVFIVITVIGFKMVNKIGNYENIWGYMLLYGAGAVVGMITVKLALLLSAGFIALFS